MLLRRPLLLHLPLFLWYLFTLHRDVLLSSGGRLLGAATYGGRWKYLTFINMILQTTYFGVCVLTDLVWLLPQHGKRVQRLCLRISALQDWLFAALAFPIGFFVVVSFWLLYAFDRELVYPKILDQIIPTWMNHAMHSVVLLLLMLELILVPHRWPSHKGGMAVLISFCCSYLLWVFWIRHRSAIWVYPIMEVLSPVGMGIFLIAAVLVTIALYAVGVKLHHWRWGHRDQCGSESFCVNQEQVLVSRPKLANMTGSQKCSDPDLPLCPDPSPTNTPTCSQSLSNLPPLPDTFQQKLQNLQKDGFEHLAGKLDQVIDLVENIAQCLSALAQGHAQPAEPEIHSPSPTSVSLRTNLTTVVQSKPAGVFSVEPEVEIGTPKEISNPKHTRLPFKTQLPSLRKAMKGISSTSSGAQAECSSPRLDS